MAQDLEKSGFVNFVYILTSRGLVARYATDRVPEQTYIDMKNVETRQENALSLRFGHTAITVNGTVNAPLGGKVIQLGRLKDIDADNDGDAETWRYASAGGNLYRSPKNDATGAWTQIATGLSTTKRPAMVPYLLVFTAHPHLFIADANKMLVDAGGDAAAVAWGTLWPQRAADNFVEPFQNGSFLGGEYFSSDTTYTYSGVAGHSTVSVGSATGIISSVNHYQTIITNISAVSGFSSGCIVTSPALNPAGAPETFYIEVVDATNNIFYCTTLGFYQSTSIPVSINRPAVQITTPSGAGGVCTVSRDVHLTPYNWNPLTNAQNPTIELRALIADPTKISTVKLELSINDASFSSEYNYTLGGSNFQTNVETVINIPLSSFSTIGSTLTPWLIYAWRITITNAGGGSTTIDLLSLQWNANSGLSTQVGGTIPYDYRYTYFNANTGEETAPSPVQLLTSANNPVQPCDVNVAVLPIGLNVYTGSDPSPTNVNIYRRGGTISNGWYLIGQIKYAPNSTISYIDAAPDSVAIEGQILAIDNYPPITSTLPTAVNTTLTANATGGPPTNFYCNLTNISVNQQVTIGQGGTQETVTVISLGSGFFTANNQFQHYAGEAVYAEAAWAQPANIACVAFDQMFIAGDMYNPGRLYYSNVSAPYSFPPQNYIDVGAEVIKGMSVQDGLLYVYTLTGIYEVVSISGSAPVAVKMNVRHGLFSTNTVVAGEGVMFYLSSDGVYAFNGNTAQEVSKVMQWVFYEYSETNGPVPVMDLTQQEAVCTGFYRNEIYFAYIAQTSGVIYRAIFSQRDGRWRYDTVPATAMLYEEDTGNLIYGDVNGMVYLDRTGDVDMNGYISNAPNIVPVTFNFETSALDQGAPKNPKVYQEFTIDINTYGQPVTINLLLNNLVTILPLGTVNTSSRQQINFALNNGLGTQAINVAFQITSSVTANFDLFELHLKALITSELRTSSDTYWMNYGEDGYKLIKQGWFEYQSTAPISVSCYTDGNVTSPAFTLTLPSTNNLRVISQVRFPATKAKLFRWITDSGTSYQMYPDSYIEVKSVCGPKGWGKAPLTS